MRVAHLVFHHSALDGRVFDKQCRTLAAAGFEVHIVAREAPSRPVDGVLFHSLEGGARLKQNSLRRAALLPAIVGRRLWNVYRNARSIKASVYHIHEPQLIPVGLLLKARGAKVIYDAHEDYHEVSLRVWRRSPFRGARNLVAHGVLEFAAKHLFDAIVAATPAIARAFPPAKTVIVRNYPRLREHVGQRMSYCRRPPKAIYIGGISEERGIREIVDAMERVPESLGARLVLAGKFSQTGLLDEVKRATGWRRVDFLGWQSGEAARCLLDTARIGLVTLHAVPNHQESLPVKLFEYLEAGIPVIASDFPLWRDIIERADCGVLVDPRDACAIADAVEWLLTNDAEAERMGERGRAAVLSEYNWESQTADFLNLYSGFSGN